MALMDVWVRSQWVNSLVRIFSVLLLSGGCVAQQQIDMEHKVFQIGPINYFGYEGIDLSPIRSALPLHTGDSLMHASFSDAPAKEVITRLTGHAPTDVNVTCCDQAGHLLLFIGLAGASSRPVPSRAMPNRSLSLDKRAVRMYDAETQALQAAVVNNQAGEDDSRGYMLSKDPALRRINLAMRAYALHREGELIRVLRDAADARQRRMAAAFLGYVERSPTQVKALAQAATDSDDEVRNNAVRALWVLSAGQNAGPLRVDALPFIDLLFSGKWTDRNKGSLFLAKLTAHRDPELLQSLREQALAPLIEGASWTGDPGHSSAFLVILGRIGGLPDEEIEHLINTGASAQVIAAASAGGPDEE